MFRLPKRAGRWPLALFALALIALGACAGDQQPLSAPTAQPRMTSLAATTITVSNSKGNTDVGSLRWAVSQATGGEVIGFDSRLAGATITLDTTLVISTSLTIEGPADKGITISGGAKGRVIEVAVVNAVLPTTTLRNLSITGGKLAVGGGAGIRASSPISIEHTTVWGNESVFAPAIWATDYMSLANSTVSGNTSTGYMQPAISATSSATIDNSTIAYNSQGGIGFSQYYSAVLRNSIVANNGGYLNNCVSWDVLHYEGTNLSNDTSCGDATTMLIADPMLESLSDNGGPSMTHALATLSPAFNGAPGCAFSVDQRYVPRDARCDIGAFESTERTTVNVVIDRQAILSVTANTAFVSGTVACSRPDETFVLQVSIKQKGGSAAGSGTVSVTCTTTTQPWTASVLASTGAFGSGSASATAATSQTQSWVAPATVSRTIKLLVPSA